MEEVKMYRCSICKHLYYDVTTAIKCEKNHKKISSVKPEYKRMLHEPDGYPNLIKVIFEDGTDLDYMRYNGKEYKHE